MSKVDLENSVHAPYMRIQIDIDGTVYFQLAFPTGPKLHTIMHLDELQSVIDEMAFKYAMLKLKVKEGTDSIQ